MKIALYTRVSTSGKGQDTEVQARELREYATRRGWDVVQEYTDNGVSGAKESRPALDRLMQDARRRKFDGVLCWKLDRIGRSLKHLVNLLAELEAVGVALVSFSDNLDLSTPQGRLMFQIIGAMAEFERSLTVERVRAGIAHARSKGKRLGRPKVSVNAAQINRLRESGASWAVVCRETGLSAGTARRTYQGLAKIPSNSVQIGAA
jgi:DNA invertase Pin-like site-specific DNA recombinase